MSMFLLKASAEDHWFLLLNILRCPNGIGSWATEFVQLPLSLQKHRGGSSSQRNELPLPLDSAEISHCISVLYIMLLPIKKRNEYLKERTEVDFDKKLAVSYLHMRLYIAAIKS